MSRRGSQHKKRFLDEPLARAFISFSFWFGCASSFDCVLAISKSCYCYSTAAAAATTSLIHAVPTEVHATHMKASSLLTSQASPGAIAVHRPPVGHAGGRRSGLNTLTSLDRGRNASRRAAGCITVPTSSLSFSIVTQSQSRVVWYDSGENLEYGRQRARESVRARSAAIRARVRMGRTRGGSGWTTVGQERCPTPGRGRSRW